MQYRKFGQTGIEVSAVGMGANRFPLEDMKNYSGIERAASIIINAADNGVNFFDSAPSYSGGKCEEILRMALKQINKPIHICSKSSCYNQRNKDEFLRYVEGSLKKIGINCFDFYFMWNVKSLAQYRIIMEKGGAYDGAVEAIKRGLIKHICFSSHAPVSDALKIIADGAFEGILLSYSLLNFRENEPILSAASEKNMGVAVMNPLGGGIIPQNATVFSDAMLDGDRDVIDSALKFVYADKAISTVLCGVSSLSELVADVDSLSKDDVYQTQRQEQVRKKLRALNGFCTGCGYCAGCPKGIPTSKLMQAYNQTLFEAGETIFNRNDEGMKKKINFFRYLEGNFVFENDDNPCIKCGRCEKICTQHLPIMERVATIYSWVKESTVSTDSRRKLFKDWTQYKRIGFYTAGYYTSFVLNMYKELIGEPTFTIFIIDSDIKKRGEMFLNQFTVQSPDDIPKLNLDAVIITNYIHETEIYASLKEKYPNENIIKLHKDKDVPFSF